MARRKNSAELYEILRRIAEQKEAGPPRKAPARAFSLKGLFRRSTKPLPPQRPSERPQPAERSSRDPVSPSRTIRAGGFDEPAPETRRTASSRSPAVEPTRPAPRGYREYLAFAGRAVAAAIGDSAPSEPRDGDTTTRTALERPTAEKRTGGAGFLGFRSVLSPWRPRDAAVEREPVERESIEREPIERELIEREPSEARSSPVPERESAAAEMEGASTPAFLRIPAGPAGGEGRTRRIDPEPATVAEEAPRAVVEAKTAAAPVAAVATATAEVVAPVELIAPIEEDDIESVYVPAGAGPDGDADRRAGPRPGGAPIDQPPAVPAGDGGGRDDVAPREASRRRREPTAASGSTESTAAPKAAQGRGDGLPAPTRLPVPRFASSGAAASKPGWRQRLGRLPARLLHGVLGDDVLKLFRKPLEVRLGTLLVAFTVIGISVAIAAVSLIRRGMREPPFASVETLSPDALERSSLADGEGATAEVAILDADTARPAAPADLFPGLARGYSLPGVHLPDPDPMPEIRNVRGAAEGGDGSAPPPEVAARLFAPADPAVLAGRWVVQAHAFLTEEFFIHLAGHLRGPLGFDNVLRGPMNSSRTDGPFYILFLGPFDDSGKAKAAKDRLIESYAARPLLRPGVPKSLAGAYEWQFGSDQGRDLEVFLGE